MSLGSTVRWVAAESRSANDRMLVAGVPISTPAPSPPKRPTAAAILARDVPNRESLLTAIVRIGGVRRGQVRGTLRPIERATAPVASPELFGQEHRHVRRQRRGDVETRHDRVAVE
jgi:hypothetical protein